METRAGMPLEGSEVSRGCFQPQTLGSVNVKLDYSQSVLGVGTGRSRLRGAGGPISISQGGKGAKATNTHRQAKNARSLRSTDANNKSEDCKRIRHTNGQGQGVKKTELKRENIIRI